MDETYIKVKGEWYYLYRAVDKENNTIDFLLTKKRDKKAARRFLVKAIQNNGLPGRVTVDKSGSNKAAVDLLNAENSTDIEIRQITCLNNIVEQGHRGIKRIVRPMLGFKSFKSASVTLKGIELVRMIQKGQMENQDQDGKNSAEIFYSLVV